MHKPVGYVSGQAEDGYEPAVVLINPDNRWDKDRSNIRFQPNHLHTLAADDGSKRCLRSVTKLS